MQESEFVMKSQHDLTVISGCGLIVSGLLVYFSGWSAMRDSAHVIGIVFALLGLTFAVVGASRWLLSRRSDDEDRLG